MDYKQRAKEWYKRALNENDVFVKFILFYISLEVITKLGRFTRIRDIKSNSDVKNFFFNQISSEEISELKEKLDKKPLENMNPNGDNRWSGKLNSTSDFESIIEFIIRARNNLFHGDKGPDEERDLFIVSWGNILIEPIVGELIE